MLPVTGTGWCWGGSSGCGVLRCLWSGPGLKAEVVAGLLA